jgi:hypothetical protein
MLANFMTYAPLPLVLSTIWIMAIAGILVAIVLTFSAVHVVYETYLEDLEG